MGLLKPILLAIARRKAVEWSSEVTPVVDGDLQCKLLDGKVTVVRDQECFPHVYATTEHDVYFTQGYIHAQERLWSMELVRRLGSGTLSEVFGPGALPTDKFARVLGWRRLAATTLKALTTDSPACAVMLDSYVAGLNWFLESEQGKLAVEFKLAGFTPQPWTTLDLITVERVMGFQLSAGFQHKIIRARLIEAIGVERSAVIGYHEPDLPGCIPDAVNFTDIDRELADRLTDITDMFDSLSVAEEKQGNAGINRGQGSNAWAIHGSRTQSGKPLLATDPHLKLALPNIWYMMHLVVRSEDGKEEGLNMIGPGLPGFPGIMSGHNQHIAWGITLSYIDVEDVYLEKFKDDTTYLFKDEWRKATTLVEAIVVKGEAEPVLQKVTQTHHGPVISDLIGDFVDDAYAAAETADGNDAKVQYKVALASKTFASISHCTQTLFELNRAKNWDDFGASCLRMNTPAFNLVYADVHGDIGYWMPGECPLRAKNHSGLLPVLGWTGDYDWKGIVPKAEMPHVKNPEAGWVISCNHKAVPDDYPHNLGNIWWWGYRAKTGAKHLAAKSKNWTLQDCSALQMNVYSQHGEDFLTILREGKVNSLSDKASSREQKAFQIMLAWDCELDVDSVGGCIYEVLIYSLIDLVFETGLINGIKEQEKDEAVLSERVDRFMHLLKGHPFQTKVKGKNEIGSFTHAMLLRMLAGEETDYWVTQVGGLQVAIETAMKTTIAVLEQKFGSQAPLSDWKWGDIHHLNLEHPLSSQLGHDPFDRRGYRIGGDALTLNMATVSMDGEYNAATQAGVSVRMVMDLSDLKHSKWMMPGGQSGHVGSKHYNDLTRRFLDGGTETLNYSDEQVQQAALYEMHLSPHTKDIQQPPQRSSAVKINKGPISVQNVVLILLCAVLYALYTTYLA